MRRSRHLPLTLSVLLAASVAGSPGAYGQSGEVDTADAHAKEARAHYDQGRFDQAVSAYLKAYRLSPSAGFLYNVAVIYHRKLNEPELAIDFYRRYIKAEDAEPSAVERATARLKVLKEATERARPEPAPAPRSAPAPGPSVERAIEAPPPAEAPAPGRRVAAFTLLGIGGAALVGGVTLGLLASSVEEKYQGADTVSDKKNLQALGRSEALAGDILMGGGLLLAGVGATLLLTGGGPSGASPAADAEPAVGLMPLPGGLGLFLEGAL